MKGRRKRNQEKIEKEEMIKKGNMEKVKAKEGNRRGRKRKTERGIPSGEQSVKKFLLNRKEKEIVTTPKRKRKENEED